MTAIDVMFSVHDYDQDGDVYEAGIFLHFGGVRIKAAATIEEFRWLAQRISGMEDEIRENYITETLSPSPPADADEGP